ncbi:MAG: hypothetical protein ACE5PV_22320 [Candidatus Poribacteria bacterium]
MSSTKIFLDNTIQIERIIVPSRRAIIQPHLTAEGVRVISSTYLLDVAQASCLRTNCLLFIML